MITEVKEIHKCEYCRKIYQVKRFAEWHEVVCKKNPDNKRACFGCEFLEKKEKTLYEDHPLGGEYEYKRDLLFCKKKEIYLYPPVVEHKGNWFELGINNDPMPKECSDFKNELL